MSADTLYHRHDCVSCMKMSVEVPEHKMFKHVPVFCTMYYKQAPKVSQKPGIIVFFTSITITFCCITINKISTSY